jgi:hypothetical protein
VEQDLSRISILLRCLAGFIVGASSLLIRCYHTLTNSTAMNAANFASFFIAHLKEKPKVHPAYQIVKQKSEDELCK